MLSGQDEADAGPAGYEREGEISRDLRECMAQKITTNPPRCPHVLGGRD
jgi:hypothetical protein